MSPGNLLKGAVIQVWTSGMNRGLTLWIERLERLELDATLVSDVPDMTGKKNSGSLAASFFLRGRFSGLKLAL